MLCIIFGEIPEDMEKKYVYNTSMYFDNTYLDNWLTDDLSVKMIKSVDKAVVLSPNAVDSKALGVIPVTKISGGLKTLLLLRHDDTKIFNASTCGDNCAKWILRIAKESKKDIVINLRHVMDFGDKTFEISRRVQYKFSVIRNITILRGDSATGKTTLIDMIAAYQENGEASGVTVISKKQCSVLSGIRWQENLSLIHDSIVFIDEGDKFVASEDFAKAIKNTDNYYVIATRTSLFNLPYSVKEIYGIKNVSGNRFQGTKRLYAEFYPLCRVDTDISLKPDLVITEDSKSGYRFFENYFSEYGINCVSAASKAKIYNELITRQYETVLVIADGAAFGPEIQRVLSLRKAKNIVLFLPESFEWVILRSGIVKDKEIKTILEKPYDYIESGKYFSWERFFTAVLTEKTKDTYLEYDKSHLNKNYINPGEKDAILSAMPEIKL